MKAGLARLTHQLAACPQPYPRTVGVQHPEGAVDGACLGFGELRRQLVQLDIARMDQPADLPESEQIVLRLQAQNVEHGMRPEQPATREIPVPQSAAAAVQRGVNAAANGVIDQIGFAGAHGLPVKRKAEDQEHKSGRRREGDRERGVRAPYREGVGARLQDRHLAVRLKVVHTDQHRSAVRLYEFLSAGAGAQNGHYLGVAQHTGQRSADRPDCGRRRRNDDAVRVRNQNTATQIRGARRHNPLDSLET